MKTWRIGSNWGEDNSILHVFKKHRIAFAGLEVKDRILQIKKGDLVGITNGNQFVGVGKAEVLIDLNTIDPEYTIVYSDVKAIEFDSLFLADDYEIDFGSYDGQGKQFHESHGDYRTHLIQLYNQLNKIEVKKKIESLLQFKKQIILQGPPGTGKTRFAKEIARSMTVPPELSIEQIKLSLNPNMKVRSAKDYVDYIVTRLGDIGISLKNESGMPITSSYTEIIQAFKNKTWDVGTLQNGQQSYAAAIAKYIFESIKNDNVKIIQFHPAYSYEDFVRGITAKSTNSQVEYKTENKTLADFAQKAYKNYIDSKKDKHQVSQENWLNRKFRDFIISINERLTNKESIQLTDGRSIISIDDKRFTYGEYEYLNFSEIKKLYQYKISKAEELIDNKNLQSHVKWRLSYYNPVVDMFKKFLGDEKPPLEVGSLIKLENYVLIIDEINRANLPSVLGELIYALEYRGEAVEGMYEIEGDKTIVLPPNLFIIGTMNTADRSVGHIDYAIKRRFAFVDILPSPSPVNEAGKELFKKVSSLFIKNFDMINWADPKLERSIHLANEFRPEDVWLGHSYFITFEKDENGKLLDQSEQIKIKLKYEIIPILKEYVKDGILNESSLEEIAKL